MNDQNPTPTGQGAAETAPTAPAVNITPKTPEGAARQRAGRRRGGSNGRAVALIGLGQELPTVSLRTHEDRMSVIEAVVSAVAGGKTSGLVAQTLLAAVREARTDSTAELERLVQLQAQRIQELEAGGVVTVRR
jgi:hypothetical protein